MSLLNGVISISNTYTFFLVLFGVLLFGYLIGRITIKGVSLGDAGVFIIALLFGALFFNMNEAGDLLFVASTKPYDFSAGLTIVEALGLILLNYAFHSAYLHVYPLWLFLVPWQQLHTHEG